MNYYFSCNVVRHCSLLAVPLVAFSASKSTDDFKINKDLVDKIIQTNRKPVTISFNYDRSFDREKQQCSFMADLTKQDFLYTEKTSSCFSKYHLSAGKTTLIKKDALKSNQDVYISPSYSYQDYRDVLWFEHGEVALKILPMLSALPADSFSLLIEKKEGAPVLVLKNKAISFSFDVKSGALLNISQYSSSTNQLLREYSYKNHINVGGLSVPLDVDYKTFNNNSVVQHQSYRLNKDSVCVNTNIESAKFLPDIMVGAKVMDRIENKFFIFDGISADGNSEVVSKELDKLIKQSSK
jgi:hypothetical protein